MKQVQIKGCIAYRAESWLEDGERFRFLMYDPREVKGCRDLFVREHTITVEVPEDFDPRPAQVAQLVAEKERIRAEFAARITELDTQINNLLALEHSA